MAVCSKNSVSFLGEASGQLKLQMQLASNAVSVLSASDTSASNPVSNPCLERRLFPSLEQCCLHQNLIGEKSQFHPHDATAVRQLVKYRMSELNTVKVLNHDQQERDSQDNEIESIVPGSGNTIQLDHGQELRLMDATGKSSRLAS